MKNATMIPIFIIMIMGICAHAQNPTYLENDKVQVFADALTKPELGLHVVYATAHALSEGSCDSLRKWVEAEDIYSFTNKSMGARTWKDLILCRLLSPASGNIDECFFVYDPHITTTGMDPPFVPLMPGSRWVMVIGPVLSSERKAISSGIEQCAVDAAPIFTPSNIFSLYQKPNGLLCLEDTDKYKKPGKRAEAIYPPEVASDIDKIQAVISIGGNTNEIILLKHKMKAEFSRNLLDEIIKRLQPPSFEEQMRSDIKNLWRARWKGESISAEEAMARMRECEKQLRVAHEKGDLVPTAYVEMMNKLGLDVKNNPDQHLPEPRTKRANTLEEIQQQ